MASPKRKKTLPIPSPKISPKLSTKSQKPKKKNQTKPPFPPPSFWVGRDPIESYSHFERRPRPELPFIYDEHEREDEQDGQDEQAEQDKQVISALHAMRDKKLLSFYVSFGENLFEPDIRIEFRKYKGEEGPSWVNMSISIDEHITLDAIKNYWPMIKKWRDVLRKFQGPWNYNKRIFFYKELHDENLQGRVGYGTLAKNCNRGIEQLLKEGYEEDSPAPELWPMRMMIALGIGEEEARAWCESALDDIRAGRAPNFAVGKQPYTQPITLEHVRKKLEWFRKNYTLPRPQKNMPRHK